MKRAPKQKFECAEKKSVLSRGRLRQRAEVDERFEAFHLPCENGKNNPARANRGCELLWCRCTKPKGVAEAETQCTLCASILLSATRHRANEKEERYFNGVSYLLLVLATMDSILDLWFT